MRISGSSAVPALLVVLLACAAARVAVVVGASACDGISCGMGSCKEIPPLFPIISNVSTYECDCIPGWLNFVPFVTLTACYIPSPACFTDTSCYRPKFKVPPLGSNVTLHPCLGMDCGEGTCVEPEPGKLQCQCQQGATNLRNDAAFPCATNCYVSEDGCPVPNPPPPPPSTASPGNDNESSGPTAPSSTKGNLSSLGYVCFQNLLLASLAALHVVSTL